MGVRCSILFRHLWKPCRRRICDASNGKFRIDHLLFASSRHIDIKNIFIVDCQITYRRADHVFCTCINDKSISSLLFQRCCCCCLSCLRFLVLPYFCTASTNAVPPPNWYTSIWNSAQFCDYMTNALHASCITTKTPRLEFSYLRINSMIYPTGWIGFDAQAW